MDTKRKKEIEKKIKEEIRSNREWYNEVKSWKYDISEKILIGLTGQKVYFVVSEYEGNAHVCLKDLENLPVVDIIVEDNRIFIINHIPPYKDFSCCIDEIYKAVSFVKKVINKGIEQELKKNS